MDPIDHFEIRKILHFRRVDQKYASMSILDQ